MIELSVIIPTYNSEAQIGRALDSLAQQDYPSNRMEVLIADGGSSDSTLSVARRFENQLNLKYVDNSTRKEAEYGKALALEAASGQLVQFMDSDMWASSETLLSCLASPLMEDSSLAGSVGVYKSHSDLNLWNRFLSLDELQRDPLFQILTSNLDDFVADQQSGYELLEFTTERIPPIGGTTMFRREEIDVGRWAGHFRELDQPVALVRSGKRRFALVRRDGWIHQHCDGLKDLARKRIRNLSSLQTSFLALGDNREFIWLDTNESREVARLVRWVIGTNLLLPRLAEGLLQARRLRRLEPLLRPLVAVVVTDALLVAMLRSGSGRILISRAMRGSR